MLPRRENVRLLKQLLIESRLVGFDFVEDVFESDHARDPELASITAGTREAFLGRGCRVVGLSGCQVPTTRQPDNLTSRQPVGRQVSARSMLRCPTEAAERRVAARGTRVT